MTTDENSDATAGTQAPPKAVAAAKAFVAEHGAPSRAVVENLGKPGARIVLIGQDGAMGDVMVADTATGEAVVGAVEDLRASEWDTDTAAALTIGPEHRRRMAGSHAK